VVNCVVRKGKNEKKVRKVEFCRETRRTWRVGRKTLVGKGGGNGLASHATCVVWKEKQGYKKRRGRKGGGRVGVIRRVGYGGSGGCQEAGGWGGKGKNAEKQDRGNCSAAVGD